MRCYSRIKRALENKKGVKVRKEGEYLIISKNKKDITTYNLKFVEFSRQNADNFIDYWAYKLTTIK